MAFSAGFSGHEEGHVAVCYAEDGVRVITGGSEGDIKIYKSTKHTDVSNVLCTLWGVFSGPTAPKAGFSI